MLIFFRIASALTIAAIVFATLSPMPLRPEMGAVWGEHLVAFWAAGLLLGLSYPRQMLLVLGLLLAGAVLLEFAQYLTPDRHARVIDVAQKLAGGVLGIATASLVNFWLSRRRAARQ